MGNRKKNIVTVESLESNLLKEYARWKEIYEHGSNDPIWLDGTNIDLTRNHIIYYKRQCEELLGDNLHLYPDVYFYPLPKKLVYNFMAVSRYVSFYDEVLTSNKTLPYTEVVKFNFEQEMYWS